VAINGVGDIDDITDGSWNFSATTRAVEDGLSPHGVDSPLEATDEIEKMRVSGKISGLPRAAARSVRAG